MENEYNEYEYNEYLDEDGYPTIAALERIELWECTDASGLLDFIRSLWRYPELVGEYFTDAERETYRLDSRKRYVWLATSSGSGNEKLIGAFRRNRFLYKTCRVIERRDGYFIFEYDGLLKERD